LNNNNNILSNKLQNFDVAPPSFMFSQIMNKIEADNTVLSTSLKSLFNHSVTPPAAAISFGAIMNKIKETDQISQFKPLKEYAVTPPYTFAKMMEIIRAFMGTTATVAAPTTAGKVIPMGGLLKRIAAAAAILLLVGISYFTYKNLSSAEGNASSIASNGGSTNNNATPPPTNSNTTANNNITTPPAIDSNNILSKNSNQIASVYSNRKVNSSYSNDNPYFPTNTNRKGRNGAKSAAAKFGFGANLEIPVAQELNLGGSSVPIVDNDFLATFASLTETNLPPFLQAEKPVATVITIDEYTDITISENMGAMMKKMYKTKKSGKPTRRARKTKEKLEKWKKADADYFNANTTMNPLDPFDLGNFILQK
jgi:hypothetical protein